MIDEKSLTLGIGIGVALCGLFSWGKLIRDTEIQRLHDSGIDFDRYFAVRDRSALEWWKKRDRA